MRKGETIACRAEKLAWLEAVAGESGDGGCRDWPWTRSAKGYGQVLWLGRYRRVGHVVMELSGRPRPSDQHHQLHSCDRPICAAPWHLRWGTNAENRRESVERGRHATKLTTEQVCAIFLSGDEPQRVTAARFGITQRVVGRIKARKSWRHVTDSIPAATCRIHPPNGEPAAMWLSLDSVTEFEESA